MVVITNVEYFEKDGTVKSFLYDPATMQYKNDTSKYTEEMLEDMGYIFVRPSPGEKEIIVKKRQDHYLTLMDKVSQKRNTVVRNEKANASECISERSNIMRYENIMETEISIIETAKFNNRNAEYIATCDGLITVANTLEVIAEGCQIGPDSKWKRVDGGYTAHLDIFPVVAFNHVHDAIKFIKLLRIKHPALTHIGYTDLRYGKLALNDIASNYVNCVQWNKPFKQDTMINISIGGGFRFSINCPHQQHFLELLNKFNNNDNISEISRIDLFIEYCRRTSPKKVEK